MSKVSYYKCHECGHECERGGLARTYAAATGEDLELCPNCYRAVEIQFVELKFYHEGIKP